MTYFPIYHRETALAVNPHYFKKLTARQAGTQHHLMGKLLADLVLERSYFVVKRSHRRSKSAQWRQHGHWGQAAYMSSVTYYVSYKIDFLVASLSWRTGRVEEHMVCVDRDSANTALLEYHASNRSETS